VKSDPDACLAKLALKPDLNGTECHFAIGPGGLIEIRSSATFGLLKVTSAGLFNYPQIPTFGVTARRESFVILLFDTASEAVRHPQAAGGALEICDGSCRDRMAVTRTA
jgi:hypothetical protein